MAKPLTVTTKLLHPGRSDSPLSTRLNRRVLQTIRDLATETKIETDPGIEDEYEFELFGNAGPPTPKQKK